MIYDSNASWEADVSDILAASSDCMKVLDLDGRLTAINRNGRCVLGIDDVAPFIGSDWLAFWKGPDRAEAERAFAAARAGREGRFVGFFRTLAGEPKWWDVVITPIRAEDRSVRALLASSRDITDRRRTSAYFSFLSDLGALIDSETDRDGVLRAIANLATESIADLCTIDILDALGRSQRIAATHRFVEQAKILQSLDSESETQSEAPRTAWKTGAVTLENNIRASDFPETSFMRRVSSLIAIPLVGEAGLSYGLITLYLVEGGRSYSYDAIDIKLAREIGRRVATAIRNSVSFQRELLIATTLQEAALPGKFPADDRVAFDGVYVAAGNQLLFGGDWYDAIAVPGGLAITVGDVSGHGLPAAVTMGRLRQSIRTAALLQASPEAVLDVADEALKLDAADALATAIAAQWNFEKGILTIASAGHPAPLLCRDGIVHRINVPAGLPLGFRRRIADIAPRLATCALRPGDLVVFFSDGLLEQDKDIISGERRLVSALQRPEVHEARKPATALCNALGVVEPRDDVVVLTVRNLSC